MKSSKEKLSIILLIIVQTVGLIGFFTPWAQEFAKLTILNIFFCFILILWNIELNSKAKVFYLILIGIIGYLIEVLGVKTALLFGSYTYGDTLGFKLFEVPVLMALNWIIPIYSTGIIAHYFSKNIWIRALIGGFLMVLLDIFLEPFAVKFDMWSWYNNQVPDQNYLAWFFISAILHLGFSKINFTKNHLAIAIYISQIVIFLTASILIK